jgi:hypothetical protein
MRTEPAVDGVEVAHGGDETDGSRHQDDGTHAYPQRRQETRYRRPHEGQQ